MDPEQIFSPMKRYFVFPLLLLSQNLVAQGQVDERVTRWLLANEKLNSVFLVLLVIFVALGIYLVRIDMRLRRLEKTMDKRKEEQASSTINR